MADEEAAVPEPALPTEFDEPDPFETPLPDNWEELQAEHQRLLKDAEDEYNNDINRLGDMDDQQLGYLEALAQAPDDYTPQTDETEDLPEEFMYITEDEIETAEPTDQEPSGVES